MPKNEAKSESHTSQIKHISFKKKHHWSKFNTEKQKKIAEQRRIEESIILSKKINLSDSSEEDDVDITSVDYSALTEENQISEETLLGNKFQEDY